MSEPNLTPTHGRLQFTMRRLLLTCTGISVYCAVLATLKPSTPPQWFDLDPLSGPVWLLACDAESDRIVGLVPCVILGLVVAVWCLCPNRRTAWAFALAGLAWLGVGFWACESHPAPVWFMM
jgi:hypothetical protein